MYLKVLRLRWISNQASWKHFGRNVRLYISPKKDNHNFLSKWLCNCNKLQKTQQTFDCVCYHLTLIKQRDIWINLWRKSTMEIMWTVCSFNVLPRTMTNSNKTYQIVRTRRTKTCLSEDTEISLSIEINELYSMRCEWIHVFVKLFRVKQSLSN